jgi:two-component system response regulator WspF
MRVAIVNDMPMAVEGLSRAVRESGDNQVAWTAWNGTEAVKHCARDVPDLILMDLIMPEMNGVEATEKIMQSTPCPILIVTASVGMNSGLVFEAMGKGAIDAISTPLFSGDRQSGASETLLRKVSMIEMLTRPVKSSRKSIKEIPLSGPVGNDHLVVIGSSSGGPEALAIVLRGLPENFQAAVVIVQHVDAQFSEGLANWLDQQTPLKVRLAKIGDKPCKGEVLLAGTDDHLIMNPNGTLRYQAEPEDMPYRPSVDVFWRSLLEYRAGCLTAILLTGMGKDGAQGMLELKRQGVYTIAQDEKSCAVFGMPKAAIGLNAAVDIMAVEDIAKTLCARQKSMLLNR